MKKAAKRRVLEKMRRGSLAERFSMNFFISRDGDKSVRLTTGACSVMDTFSIDLRSLFRFLERFLRLSGSISFLIMTAASGATSSMASRISALFFMICLTLIIAMSVSVTFPLAALFSSSEVSASWLALITESLLLSLTSSRLSRIVSAIALPQISEKSSRCCRY